MTPEQQAEIERIRRAYARFPGATVQTSAAAIVAALDEAQAEADAKRMALTASDERLILAGLRVDLYFGCDTAQHLADEIVNLRVDLRHAQAEAERLREAVTFNADQVTQAAHENAMLRAENARMREALATNETGAQE